MNEITNNVKTWECGENNKSDVIATIENKTLIIKGTGPMRDYEQGNKDGRVIPWFNENYDKIRVESGVTRIGNNSFYKSLGVYSAEIPNTVKEIGCRAFEGCTALKKVSIPEGVKVIDYGTFRGCRALETISIPEGVEIIGKQSFSDCSSLSEVKLPQSLKEINDLAFSLCSSLKIIRIPKNVIALGASIFNCCHKLTYIINERHAPLDIDDKTFDFRYTKNGSYIFNKNESSILSVPSSAVDAYKNASVWKLFKYIIPIFEDSMDVSQIEDEISKIDTRIIELNTEIDELELKRGDLHLKKAMLRGVEGNPKHVAEFMSLFNQRDGLKYLTHDIDSSDDFKFEKVLSDARKVCTENFEKLEIPKTLRQLLRQFVFENKPQWKSYNKDYSEKMEISGWSAESNEELKKNTFHPIKDPNFKETINGFRRLTRIESPNLETIVDKVFGNKGFELVKDNVSNADFYTHVGEFMSALETIFSEIEKRAANDEDKKKVVVKYVKDTIDDYFVRKIIITHVNSYPTRTDKDALLKEWVSFEKGSMAKIAEHLKGYCHWSVETKVDGEPVRVNILREKGTKPEETAEFEVEGFTHVLTFYYHS